MDIDSLASEFGSAKVSPSATDTGGIDVHGLAAEFGSGKAKESETVTRSSKPSAITIRPVDMIPIEGMTPEQRAAIPVSPNVGNPRDWLPKTDIQRKAYEADVAGKNLFTSGVEDIQSGHPYKGAAKAALGGFSRLFSPVTGLIEGGIVTPLTDITGNVNQDVPRYISGAPTGQTLAEPAGIGERAGFVASSAIPVVPGGSTVVKAIPKNKALSTLVESIGKENLPEVVAQMKANPRLAPVDLSPKVLQDTQNLFTKEGPQINYLANASKERMASSPQAIEAAYDASTGLPVNAVNKLKDLAAASRQVGEKEINPAVANAGPVNLSPVLEHIDKQLKPGVNSVITSEGSLPFTAVKKQLGDVRTWLANKNEMRTSATDLHQIQSALRNEAENLINSADGQQRALGYSLMNVRNKIVNSIDEASGGKYKPALSNYRDEKNISEAFHDGYSGVFSNSKKMENRPEFTKEWLAGLTPQELEAAKEGARVAIDTEINSAKNPALAGTNLVKSDFNKQKLKMLFGEDEANTLLTKLEHERAIANTHNKIVEGSQTAMRSASKKQFELPTKTDVLTSAPAVAALETSNYFMGGVPGVGTAILGVMKAGNTAKDAVKLALAKAHNEQYARYALPTQGPQREELIRQLEARIPKAKQSLLTRTSNVVSRFVAP